jgi:hypothetical protein
MLGGLDIKGLVFSMTVVLMLVVSSAPFLLLPMDDSSLVMDAVASVPVLADHKEEIWLDSYQIRNYPICYSQDPLTDDRPYKITIEGTWSNWPTGHWNDEDDPPVGPIEGAPMYPGQGGGEKIGIVGLDGFWMFACIWGEDYARDNGYWPLPVRTGFQISLDNGTSWNSIRPIDDAYSPMHKYESTVIGKGAKIGFKIPDSGANDNYGMLKINIEGDKDTDEDSLWDLWEKEGIDFNLDGEVDLDLPMLGADWEHKDIFVEGDYMAGKAPNQGALDDVIAAFYNAQVQNPDGVKGINLHILVNDEIPWQDTIGFNDWFIFTDFYDLKEEYFGTEDERNNINAIKAKKMLYRYCIFANKLSINGVDPECPGVAEGILCDDFILAFGAFKDGIGSRKDQAAVFMHELGHTLGLGHGGNVSVNYKPNYLSIMNYAFQYDILAPTRPLDYSYGKCIDLDESKLDEFKGIGQAKATVWRGPNNTIYRHTNGIPIDWEYNGRIDNRSVEMNVNNHDGSSPPNEILMDFNDWANLVYKFRGTPLYVASATPEDYHIELTTDQIAQMEEEAPNIIVVDSPNAEDPEAGLSIETVLAIIAVAAIVVVVAVLFFMRKKK